MIDLLLGFIVLAIACAWSWKLALVLFCVVSYVAGGAILVVVAIFIGIVLQEKFRAWIE